MIRCKFEFSWVTLHGEVSLSKHGNCPSFDNNHPGRIRITEFDENLKILRGKFQLKIPFKTRRWPKEIFSELLYNLATAPGMTRTRFRNAEFVHLQGEGVRKKHSHPLLQNSNMAFVEIDDKVLIPQAFAGQEPVMVNSLVSRGPWISQAHTELTGNENASVLSGFKFCSI